MTRSHLRGDLVAQVDGRRLGERRLGVALDAHAHLGEPLLQPVEEDVAAGLADVEQADGLALRATTAGRRQLLARLDGALAGRVEDGARLMA